MSVLPAHTKRWKDVAHNQPLKTDTKNANTITDLLTQGHFVRFPFLAPAYADLRYLVAARERLSLLRRWAMTQLRSLLQVVFPEFEAIFPLLTKKTPFAILRAFPTPDDLLKAPKAKVLCAALGQSRPSGRRNLRAADRRLRRPPWGCPERRVGCVRRSAWSSSGWRSSRLRSRAWRRRWSTPCKGARDALPPEHPQGRPGYRGRLPRLDRRSPRAYESSGQILRVAGLSLIERSSGILRGTKRISKRGRPLLRQAAYMFAVRSITEDGLFRAEYEALCQRNGGQKMKAVVAVMRSGFGSSTAWRATGGSSRPSRRCGVSGRRGKQSRPESLCWTAGRPGRRSPCSLEAAHWAGLPFYTAPWPRVRSSLR
ncbi:MAG: transposase [Gemmatimonadetes bacterium]|nr:transposase [Gemmatimonadota bacterium]